MDEATNPLKVGHSKGTHQASQANGVPRTPVRPGDRPHPLTVAEPHKSIIGYCDKISVHPGETIQFFASTYGPGNFSASLVRAINGDGLSCPDRFKAVKVPTPFSGTYPGQEQPIYTGSYARIDRIADSLDQLKSFSIVALIQLSRGTSSPQFAVSRWDALQQKGWAIGTDERGEGAAWIGDGTGHMTKLRTSRRILPGRWTMIGASFDDGTGEFRVYDVLLDDPNFPFDLTKPGDPLHYAYGNRRLVHGWRPCHSGEIRIGAACGKPTRHGLLAPAGAWNGKIDGIRITSSVLGVAEMVALATAPSQDALKYAHIEACWDFSLGIGTDKVCDLSPSKMGGHTVNWPQRGMRGYHWKAAKDWKAAPGEFTAIYCHDDDLIDAKWEPSFSYSIPSNLQSGIYAVHLEHQGSEHYIPFIVAPPKGQRLSDVALVLPTPTYLAYNNQAKAFTQIERYPAYVFNADDLTFLMDHPEFGRSIYDNHTDGTPIQISSWLRPSATITLKSWLHLVTSDSETIEWLEHTALSYDVITEDMIDREGPELIKRYRVLITGQHPEYNSTRTQNALSDFLTRGGRLMYLGGNGFTNTIAWHPTLPIMEVRKPNLDATSPIWLRDESTMMEFDGENSNLTGQWAARNVGVSFQGDVFAIYYMAGSTYYRLLPDAGSERVKFIFAGTTSNEIIGNSGAHFGGAAGDEVDSFASKLGAPDHTLHLAQSDGAAAPYWASPEVAEQYQKIYADPASNSRASITFFETPGGGAVFSVGSVAWVGALSQNHFDNDVCRMTMNVLRRFLDPAPFRFPKSNKVEKQAGDRG